MQVVDVNGNMFGYDHLEIIGIDGKPKTPPFSITIGTTAILGGTVGRVLFEGAGNVVQESANLFWDNINGRLGIGTSSPAVSIDARNGFNLYTSGAAAGSHYLEAFSTTSTDATLNFRRTAGANGLYRFTLTGAQLNSDNTTGECQLRAANSFFWSIYSNGLERIRIPLTGNILIGTTTDAGFKLDVNGTARVQGVITGSVGSGSLTLGAASANQTAIAVTGYFTGNGAITTSNSNGRGFNANIGAQNTGITVTYNGLAQGQTVINSYFLVSGNINLVDGAIDLNGFNFTPTIVSEVGATIKAFSSSLSAASNHYNLYLSGTAQNYIAGNVGIGTTSPSQVLHVAGNARVTGAIYDSTNSPGTSGQVLSSTVTGTAWVAAGGGGGGGGGGIHALLGPKTGFVVSNNLTSTGMGSTIQVTNRLMSSPFIPAKTFTSSSLTFRVFQAVASALSKIMIYSDLNGYPNTLLFESANIDCSTTGTKTISTSFTFTAGTIYWLTFWTNSTPTVFTIASTNMYAIRTQGAVPSPANLVSVTLTYGSAPTTLTGTAESSQAMPFIGITQA
jgi:hypothetical protein